MRLISFAPQHLDVVLMHLHTIVHSAEIMRGRICPPRTKEAVNRTKVHMAKTMISSFLSNIFETSLEARVDAMFRVENSVQRVHNKFCREDVTLHVSNMWWYRERAAMNLLERDAVGHTSTWLRAKYLLGISSALRRLSFPRKVLFGKSIAGV